MESTATRTSLIAKCPQCGVNIGVRAEKQSRGSRQAIMTAKCTECGYSVEKNIISSSRGLSNCTMRQVMFAEMTNEKGMIKLQRENTENRRKEKTYNPIVIKNITIY